MKNSLDFEKIIILLTGLCIGIFSVLLFVWGNPPHTGICVSCFLENISGSLGLHKNIRMQYLRPEVMGFTIGAFLLAILNKEFKARSSSSWLINFFSGIIMIVGSAVFIGCPIKLMTRISSGEIGALCGLIGLIIGIWIAIQFIHNGFTLNETQSTSNLYGMLLPIFMFILVILLFIKPSFIYFSSTGPGSLHAPAMVSLMIGILIGGLAQRSRFCVTGSIRNFILAKNYDLLLGLILLLIAAFTTQFFTNNFELAFFRYEFINEYIWGFIAMILVGWASVFAGGCPFRQLIMAGEGDIGAGTCVMGMLFGGALVQNLSMKTTSDGISFTGQIAVLSGFIFLIIVGLVFKDKIEYKL